MMKTTKILIVISIFFFFANNLFSQQRLLNVSFSSPTRALLHFGNYPLNYATKLSDDKRKVLISLNNCSVADTARSKTGSGDFTEVYSQTTKKDITIFISFVEDRGYTAVVLPYSRAIMLDVFKWDKLSPADDAYRTALLAYEDKINESAKKDLLSAAMSKHSEAAMFLGILLLSEGKVNSAIKNLEFAEATGTNLPDLYAALSQAYNIKQDKDKSMLYADKFKTAAAATFVPLLPISAIVETDSTCTEPVAHLIIQPVIENEIDSTKVDSSGANDKFKGLFADSTAKADDSVIPGVYNEVVTMVAGVALALVLLVVLLYLKWRNKQLLAKSATATQTAEPKPKKKASPEKVAAREQAHIQAQKLFAAKAYSKSSKAQPPAKAEKPADEPAIEADNAKFQPKDQSTNDKKDLESVIANIRAAAGQSDAPTDDAEQDYSKAKPVSAKVEIAMHLAEEQRRIKQSNIDSLKNTIDIDQSKLTAMAKSLGIEKGSLETKKALEQIEQDDDAMLKLQKKFSMDK